MDNSVVNKIIFWMQEADELRDLAMIVGNSTKGIFFKRRTVFRLGQKEIRLTGVQEVAFLNFLRNEEQDIRALIWEASKNNPESYEVAMALYNNEIGIDKKYPGKG